MIYNFYSIAVVIIYVHSRGLSIFLVSVHECFVRRVMPHLVLPGSMYMICTRFAFLLTAILESECGCLWPLLRPKEMPEG